jgi:hypothetical protein
MINSRELIQIEIDVCGKDSILLGVHKHLSSAR